MNFGKDDMDMLKKIGEEITTPEFKSYIDRILKDWGSYLTLIDIFNSRIAKIERIKEETFKEINTLIIKNKRLKLIISRLNETIADLSVIQEDQQYVRTS